jgi:sugar lactone lactonase YvrE
MQPIDLELKDFVSGLGFPEAPRWHDGALWVADIVASSVLRIDGHGHVTTVLRTPGEPSGLGWLPNGHLLVVQMEAHEIWRWNGMKLHRYSGTAPMSRARLNDMVVDWNGRAWVSNLGFDYEREPPCPTNLVCVDPGGHAWIAATDLWCPNGMAIDPTGSRLIVGQSARSEIVEFEIREGGVLDKRSVFGTLPDGRVCDGLCMDSAGALWIASPTTREFLRMEPGGRITHRVSAGERHAIACVLGGPQRRTLYCLTSATLSLRAAHHMREGCIGTVAVETPGAGIP